MTVGDALRGHFKGDIFSLSFESFFSPKNLWREGREGDPNL